MISLTMQPSSLLLKVQKCTRPTLTPPPLLHQIQRTWNVLSIEVAALANAVSPV